MSTYNVTISESGDDFQDAVAEGQGDTLGAAFTMLAEDVTRDPYPLQAALDEGREIRFDLSEIPDSPR